MSHGNQQHVWKYHVVLDLEITTFVTDGELAPFPRHGIVLPRESSFQERCGDDITPLFGTWSQKDFADAKAANLCRTRDNFTGTIRSWDHSLVLMQRNVLAHEKPAPPPTDFDDFLSLTFTLGDAAFVRACAYRSALLTRLKMMPQARVGFVGM